MRLSLLTEKKKSSPLKERYDYYNEKCFGGRLPDIPVYEVSNLKSVMGRARIRIKPPEGLTVMQRKINARQGNKYLGYTPVPGSMKIELSTIYKRDQQATDALLIHEMIHIEMFTFGHYNLNHNGLFMERLREIESQVGFAIPVREDTKGYEIARSRQVAVLLVKEKHRYVYAVLHPNSVNRPDPMEIVDFAVPYFNGMVELYLVSSPAWTQEAIHVPIQTGRTRRLKFYSMKPEDVDRLVGELKTNGKLITRAMTETGGPTAFIRRG